MDPDRINIQEQKHGTNADDEGLSTVLLHGTQVIFSRECSVSRAKLSRTTCAFGKKKTARQANYKALF